MSSSSFRKYGTLKCVANSQSACFAHLYKHVIAHRLPRSEMFPLVQSLNAEGFRKRFIGKNATVFTRLKEVAPIRDAENGV